MEFKGSQHRRTAMKAKQLNDETTNEASGDAQESTSKASLSTRLERRRRIEELNEEKRLREESSEFLS